MKLTTLTTLVIANALVLIIGIVLACLGIVDCYLPINNFLLGLLVACVAVGSAVAIERRDAKACPAAEA